MYRGLSYLRNIMLVVICFIILSLVSVSDLAIINTFFLCQHPEHQHVINYKYTCFNWSESWFKGYFKSSL